MAAYSLTRSEVWTLSTFLHLPIQPESAIGAWLGVEDPPEDAGLPARDIASLTGKGYYSAGSKDQPVLPDLVRSLTLAGVNAVEISIIIQRHGQSALTHFAQVGKGLVQYGWDEQQLFLHPVTNQEAIAADLIPGWFNVSRYDPLHADMPLGAFLLFKQACTLADLSAGDTILGSEMFEKGELLERFKTSTDQGKIFHTEEGSGTYSAGQEPLDDLLQTLLAKGFLRKITASTLEVGAAGKALAESFSDPDLCTLTVSSQIWGNAFPDTAVFLYGGEQLFFLNITPDKVHIRQLADCHDGIPWVKDLLVKGSQGHYAEYIIPPEH